MRVIGHHIPPIITTNQCKKGFECYIRLKCDAVRFDNINWLTFRRHKEPSPAGLKKYSIRRFKMTPCHLIIRIILYLFFCRNQPEGYKFNYSEQVTTQNLFFLRWCWYGFVRWMLQLWKHDEWTSPTCVKAVFCRFWLITAFLHTTLQSGILHSHYLKRWQDTLSDTNTLDVLNTVTLHPKIISSISPWSKDLPQPTYSSGLH